MSEDVSIQPSDGTSTAEDVPVQPSNGTSTSNGIPVQPLESTSASEFVPVQSSDETSMSEDVPAKTPEGTSANEVVPVELSESASKDIPAKSPTKTAKAGNRALDIFKRILVGIVMVLTLVGLLVNMSQLVAVWVAYGPARNSVITVSNTLIQGLQVADKGLTRANGYVTQARQTVTDVNNAASLLGDKIQSNSPLIAALGERVDAKLAPVLDKVQTTTSTIHDATLKVNGALEALNRFPSVTLPTLNDQLATISGRAQQAESAAQDLRVALANIKAGVVTKAQTTVKKVTARIDAPLSQIQSLINTYQTKVINAQSRVTSTENQILTLLLVTAISLTILSLVVTIALLLLFLLCLQFVIHGRFPSLRVAANNAG